MLSVAEESCVEQFFVVFGLTRPGFKPRSIVSAAEASSSRRLLSGRPKVFYGVLCEWPIPPPIGKSPRSGDLIRRPFCWQFVVVALVASCL